MIPQRARCTVLAGALAQGCFYNPVGGESATTKAEASFTDSDAMIPTTDSQPEPASSSGHTGPESGSDGPPTCNANGTCEEGESSQSCPDCKDCGNGVVEAGELCDDGAGNSPDNAYHAGDAATAPCNSSCTGLVGHCGDETCQPDDEASANCPADCSAGCGNGVHDADEECDDGNLNNDDACLDNCVFASCGDSFVQAGVEDCDDGNVADDDACVLCKPAVCGDGHAWAGMEDCDDGNQDETDLCTNACTAVIARQVFVSSASFNGKFNTNAPTGLEGADGRCQGLAAVAGLNGTFKAWLSDSTTGPADRFDTAFTGVYKLIDGTPVAVGWTDLTDGTLLHAINVTESGAKDVDAVVWSNTTPQGEPLGTLHCSDWTSLAAQPKGALGYSSTLDSTWTDAMDASSCAGLNALYCFEDPA